MKKRMKKSLCFMLILIICLQRPQYTSTVFSDSLHSNETDKPDFFGGAVSIGTVLGYSIDYSFGNESAKSCEAFFSRNAVPMVISADSGLYYAVMDDDGDYAYRIYSEAALNGGKEQEIYLKSCLTYDSISLISNVEEMNQFLEKERTRKHIIIKKKKWLLKHLDEADYAGSYYSLADGKIHVYLVNEEKREELEAEDFVCESTPCSLAEQYKAIEELWRHRKETGIIDIKTNPQTGLIIYGTNSEEVFMEKTKDIAFNIPYQYKRGVWTAFGTLGEEYISDDLEAEFLECLEMDFEEPEEFIDYLRQADKTYEEHVKEEEWEYLEKAVLEFKQAYPDYSCRNIYYHIAGDYNAAAYMDFEPELLEFTDTLPAYIPDKNAVLEEIYGDPQRLELKRMLRQCKEISPEKSYEEIYACYIKESEEDQLRTREEKLYWYLWEKYSGEIKMTGYYDSGEISKIFIYDFIHESNCFIRMDDIYSMIDAYLENPGLSEQEAEELLKKWIGKYVSFPSDDYYVPFIDVVGEDGYIDYTFSLHEYYSSASQNSVKILHSCWTDEEISLNEPREEIENFIERTNNIAGQIKEKLFFVRNNLQDNEYSSVYVDYERNVHVTLVNKEKASMLEEAGILWENTGLTRNKMYDKLQYLWENREYLNICTVNMYGDEEKILICGYDESEEFYKKLNDDRFQKDYYSQENKYNTLEEFLTDKIDGYFYGSVK